MQFRNPNNGYIETVSAPGLWCFLFGPLYFAIKGAWSHALISAVVALLTGGLSWLIYPFFASKVIEQQYLRSGWTKLEGNPSAPTAGGAVHSGVPVSTSSSGKRSLASTLAKVVLGLLIANFILLIGFAITSPNSPRPASSKADDDLNAWRYSNIEWAKQVVAKALRDPDSAKFRDVTVVAPEHFDRKKPGTVCGYVNAKNGFGALTGYEPFIVMAGAIPILDDHTNEFAKLWNQSCANKSML